MRKMLERWDATAAKPENQYRFRSEIWRWWRRHPVMLMILTVVVSLFAFQCAYVGWLLYGWRPDVVVEGQIVDFDTKQPVEGAWVLIHIWADGRYFNSKGKLIGILPEGARTGMTSPASTVVQTDKEGRFHYRVSAYDAYQFAGYTVHGVNLGVYKAGYESVDSRSGRSEEGGENYLPFMSPAPGRDWPSLKRVGNSLEQRRLSRDDFPSGAGVMPSEVTWPQWAKFLHAVAEDEVNHWCSATTVNEEKLSHVSFYSAIALITEQERLLEANPVTPNHPERSATTRELRLSRLRSLDEDRRDAAPDYPWPEPYDIEPSPRRELQYIPSAPAFTVPQRDVLCQVMLRQSDNILSQSLDIRNTSQ